MDEKRVEGTVRDVSGKVQEGLGRVTGDLKRKPKALLIKPLAQPKTFTVRRPTPLPIAQQRWISGFATLLRDSHTQRRSSRWVSA